MFLKTGKTQSRRNRKEVSAMAVTLNAKYLEPFVHEGELQAILPQVEAAHRTIHEKSGPGNDFLGWIDLPINYDKAEFDRIKGRAKKIQQQSRCWLSSASAAPTWARGPPSSYIISNSTTPWEGHAADLFCGQHHQPTYLNTSSPLRGRGLLGQRHLQVRHHHRAGAGLPRLSDLAIEKVRPRGREGAHLLHHRQGPRHLKAAGGRGRVRDLCHPGRRRRTLLGADRGGTAADCGGRFGHRQAHGGRSQGKGGFERLRP